MTSMFEQLVNAAQTSLAAVAESLTLTAEASAALSEAEAVLATISRGSNSYKLTVTIEALAAATTSLEQSEAATRSAHNQFSEYLSAIGVSSTVGPSVEKSPRERSKLNFVSHQAHKGFDHHALAKKLGLLGNRPPGDAPVFNPRQRNPSCFQGLAPYRDVDTAEGNLFFPDGRRWNIEPIRADQANAAVNSEDLKPEFHRMRVVWHVEGAVAAWMRDEGINEMALYLNTERCRYPDGCFQQLHKLLPHGAKLHLQGVGPNGKPWRTTLTGTGEAIR